MKIVFCKWNNICEDGIETGFKNLGCELLYVDAILDSVDYDKNYLDALSNVLKQNTDVFCVFSSNFIPIVSRVCKVFRIPYASWTSDSPSFPLFSQALVSPYNRIFLFDRLQYNKFLPYNPNCIFHLPLASDISNFDEIDILETDISRYSCDISFVGSLYSEKSKYNYIEKDLPDYIRGYVDGLINAQLNVFGYNFIEDSLTNEFVSDFKKYANWLPLGSDYYEDVKSIIADTYLGYKCTEMDRINTFNEIGKNFKMDLYTLSDTSCLKNINCRGGADTKTMMPKIFRTSKINLNLTNKPIKSGIPQRVFDIIGNGGFLITNFQSEILEHFTPDEEIVVYENLQDLIFKIDFYLNNPNERERIRINGYNKVKKDYSYEKVLSKLLTMI